MKEAITISERTLHFSFNSIYCPPVGSLYIICMYVNMYVKGQVRENRLLVSVNSGFELDRHEGTLDVSFIKMAQKTMRRGNTDEKALQTI